MFIVIACVKAEALCKWEEHVTILIQREIAARAWGGVGSRAAAEGAEAPGNGVTDGAGVSSGHVATAEFLKRRNAIYQHQAATCSRDAAREGARLIFFLLRGSEFQQQILLILRTQENEIF